MTICYDLLIKENDNIIIKVIYTCMVNGSLNTDNNLTFVKNYKK
jgi:hypothetical protein